MWSKLEILSNKALSKISDILLRSSNCASGFSGCTKGIGWTEEFSNVDPLLISIYLGDGMDGPGTNVSVSKSVLSSNSNG